LPDVRHSCLPFLPGPLQRAQVGDERPRSAAFLFDHLVRRIASLRATPIFRW
jgi:hypothetical protein